MNFEKFYGQYYWYDDVLAKIPSFLREILFSFEVFRFLKVGMSDTVIFLNTHLKSRNFLGSAGH